LSAAEFVNGLLRHQRRGSFGSDDLHIPIGEELVAEVVVTLDDVETTTIVDAVLNGVARGVRVQSGESSVIGGDRRHVATGPTYR